MAIVNKKITIEIEPFLVLQSLERVRMSVRWTVNGEQRESVSVFQGTVPMSTYLYVIEKLIEQTMEGAEHGD